MTTMKFGISFLPDSSENTKNAPDYFRDALELCIMADEGDLTSVKMTEHYIHPYGGYCPSPLMFLSAVASRTKQLRLMTGCILPVFHHPLQIAAKVAMLDALSLGRVDVGFARAYLPYEFDAFQIDMDTSRSRYMETIFTVIKLWKEKNVSAKTDFFAFEKVTSLPRPLQQPHPPIWGAAVNSRQSFVWLGEQGFNLLVSPPTGHLDRLVEYLDLYRECYKASSSNSIEPQIALSLPLIIDSDENQALQKSEKILQSYLDVWSDAANCWYNRSSTDYPKYTDLANFIKNNSPELMRKNLQALVGTPEQIIDKIHFIREKLNINYFLWQLDTGSQSAEIAKNTLQLFIEKVFPNVH